MELLAPAGSYEQAIAAIVSKCDALYGGMARWNARNRAKNFTQEQYIALLDQCRCAHVKFYMTLNTLMRDDEVDEVCDLFSSDQFPLPDAVIAADIGLIRQLRKFFPALAIHASTQFGAYTIEDIRFLEDMGVQRVILARELTLQEIQALRMQTSMELEVFVYGSQCINFSGQCLWGGMTYGGSGNRGRCIGMCRDLYRCGDKKGQFLYPQDIDALPRLPRLHELAIDSVKIEGRMRDPASTARIVRRYREAIDALPSPVTNDGYGGYLQGQLPVAGMLQAVNPRLKTLPMKDIPYDKADLLYTENPHPNMINGDEVIPNESLRYVRTVQTRPFDRGKPNISIRLKTDAQQKLDSLDLINAHGERKLYELPLDNLSRRRTREVFSKITGWMEALNLYELSASVPMNDDILLDEAALDRCMERIAAECAPQMKNRTAVCGAPRLEQVLIQSDTINDVMKFYSRGYHRFIFEVKSEPELKKILEFETANHLDVLYKIPLLQYTEAIGNFLPLLAGRKVLVSRFSDIPAVKRENIKEIYADYSLNIWNQYAALAAADLGVKGIVAHPELEMEYTKRLSAAAEMPMLYIKYGRIPLGYTRACFGELGICGQECGEALIQLENIEKGYRIQILCEDRLGYRAVLKSEIDYTPVCPDDTMCIYRLTEMREGEKELPDLEGAVEINRYHLLYQGVK